MNYHKKYQKKVINNKQNTADVLIKSNIRFQSSPNETKELQLVRTIWLFRLFGDFEI